MCGIHVHTKKVTFKGIRAYDPTYTTTLRNAMARDMKRRFTEIIRAVIKSVDEEDCFGLREPQTLASSTGKGAFRFGTHEQKVAEFLKWLEEITKDSLLTIQEIEQLGSAIYPIWTNKYIAQGYERGVKRAQTELRRIGYTIPVIEATHGFGFFSSPVHVQRAGLLYIRTYNELKGITNLMQHYISRILAEGMIRGENPRVLAKKLVAAINGRGIGDLGLTDTLGRYISPMRRAEILARTEIIRAHHSGTIQEYRNWGVVGVSLTAEFKTAGDDRVCDVCASLEGTEYTLDEAEDVIPVHPMCRCVMLPVSDSVRERKRNKK